jgi:hypothetical protein
MTEAEYWYCLEVRLCHEFAGLPERRYRYFWCDGITPLLFTLDDPSPRVTGKAWICNGSKQDQWDFTLLLNRTWRSREDIQWATLLPPDDMTRWISFDEHDRYIEIDPAAAVPDPL